MKNRENPQKNQVDSTLFSTGIKKAASNQKIKNRKQIQKSLLSYFTKPSKQKEKKVIVDSQFNDSSERKEIESSQYISQHPEYNYNYHSNNSCNEMSMNSSISYPSFSNLPMDTENPPNTCITRLSSPENHHFRPKLEAQKIKENNRIKQQQQKRLNLQEIPQFDSDKEMRGQMDQIIESASNNNNSDQDDQQMRNYEISSSQLIDVDWTQLNEMLAEGGSAKKSYACVSRKNTRSWSRYKNGNQEGEEECKNLPEESFSVNLMMEKNGVKRRERVGSMGLSGLSIWLPRMNKTLQIPMNRMRGHLSRTLKIIMESYI